MPGLRFWLPGPFRLPVGPGCRRGLPVLARAVSRRAKALGLRRVLPGRRPCDVVPSDVAFPLQAHGRHPDCVFRSSIPRPPMPLATLHPDPRGSQRKTRGQDGSLLLSCRALSSPTARRFIPAIALAHARGSETCPCVFSNLQSRDGNGAVVRRPCQHPARLAGRERRPVTRDAPAD